MHRENKLDRGIQLFDSRVLDCLSRVHPLLPCLMYGPLCILGVAWGIALGVSLLESAGVFALGFVAWTFGEYFIHRFLFHFRPSSARLRRMVYYIHEHHHRYQEKDRLLAPPLLSLGFLGFFLVLFYVAIGLTWGGARMLVFTAGFALGYLVYDYTHYFIHFVRPRTRYGKYLRRCHLQHHFARPDRWYCVSFPWLDFLFGTQLSARQLAAEEASRAPTADDLEGIPQCVLRYEQGRDGAPGRDDNPNQSDSLRRGRNRDD